MYHSAAAHWVQAVLIETVTGQDYRQYIRDNVTQPLGLEAYGLGCLIPCMSTWLAPTSARRVVSMWSLPSAIPRPSGVPVCPVVVGTLRRLI